MTGTFTREQAAEAVEVAAGERDAIQANLLELDACSGKELLSGARLTGTSRQQWILAAGKLHALWELYLRYSDVVDHASQAMARHRRLPYQRELELVTELLTQPCIDDDAEEVTAAAAVRRMRLAYAEVAQVLSAAEHAWNTVSRRLDGLAAGLDALDAPDTASPEATALRGELDRLRAALSTDPLAFWQPPGQVTVPGVDELTDRFAALKRPEE